jgi:hypothetical protein
MIFYCKIIIVVFFSILSLSFDFYKHVLSSSFRLAKKSIHNSEFKRFSDEIHCLFESFSRNDEKSVLSREKGNSFFKQKDFQKALNHYSGVKIS